MTQIPLYQQTQLPPSKVGAAKAPYSLADRSGQQQLAQTIAGVGEKIWDNIIKSQATNEVAEARGQTESFIESFNTYVASNPNASPEDLQKERQRITSQIQGLQGTLKTGLGKRDFGNFLAMNEGIINQRMLTTAAATKAKQEFTKAESQRNVFIAQGDVGEEYEKFMREHAANGIYNPDIIEETIALDKMKGNIIKVQNTVAAMKTAAANPDITREERDALFNQAEEYIQSQPASILEPQDAQAMLANLESYKNTLARKTENLNYSANMKVNESFLQKFIEDGTINPDDVLASRLKDTSVGDEITQEDWLDWNTRSFKTEPPVKSKPAASAKVTALVLDLSQQKFEGGSQGAIRSLMDMYTKGDLSKTEFAATVERMNRLYTPGTAKMLEDIMQIKAKEIKDAEDSWWYMDWEKKRVAAKSAQVNADLLRFVDEELAKNPNKTFTPKELYQMQAEINVSIPDTENGQKQTKSPFEDYPDAYLENGNWYVMKDGKRHRIEE